MNSDFDNAKKGIFLSDLHLFCRRSRPPELASQLQSYSKSEHLVVLGGDTFDLRWSAHRLLDSTVQQAIVWLSDLMRTTTDCRVIYLAGNHDSHPRLLDQLAHLSQQFERFSWFENELQVRDCLFVHGDILDACSELNGDLLTQLRVYRSHFHHDRPPLRIADLIYDLAVECRIHRLIPSLRHSAPKTCDALFRLIERLPSVNSGDLKRIYFGHTHFRIDGYEHHGRTFYNPGAALKHMQFSPFEFSFAENNG